ncbi:hypothetical protein DPSP01_013689 [Paraphaeosphaeria sporulosa]|uniref:Uncharacterized protein n=1 Tax=Paraphaeosphaeria sporulosa TaxID=1460663 RepID=A0A177CH24_9PLEO|nr:uncharacterized protein CC84DRAFT_1176087 [Paraphaeosphaeria sporulosa]OAG06007.1 hypothetical protein CC84DRAFT_1176087 [Paraphaeosphaeria sporulosa]
MGILTNPLHLLGPPLLFLVSFPLAIFAAITTGIALSLLTVRVSIVYFELGVALLHAYLYPEPPKVASRRVVPPVSPPRFRRTSTSSDSAAPAVRLYTKSGSSASLVNVNRMANARDFEGVGGWRYYEGEEEEAIWMGMNKRLELPLAIPPGRRHQRRHTGEDQRWIGSPEVLRMSPLQSRMRTPQRTPRTVGLEDDYGDEYFPPQPILRPLSTAMEPLSLSSQHSRRASVISMSGSSSNTSGSSSPESHKQLGD